jgi:antitoxin ParD1/3/4
MIIQLSGKAAEIVKAKVASGIYADAAAFISDVVLRADEFDRLKLERLRREIQLGIDELVRGEGVPFDMDEINQAVDKELGYSK